jgi:hypothetical protein
MKVTVISANLGRYDPDVPWVPQIVPAGVTVEVHRLTDATFPPRPKAMTSALQCGIPKMFGWELFPGADVYLWVDASRALRRPDTVAWFLEQAGDAELLLFRHPHRRTVQEEYEFVKAKLAAGNRYLTKRYAGEWLDAQVRAIVNGGLDPARLPLYASTAFLYRPTLDVCAMLTEWWLHKSRYLLHDQLALPYVLSRSQIQAKAIDDDVYACPHLPIVRGKR